MENKAMQLFSNNEFGEVRAIVDNKANPWFVGKDIAIALGYADSKKAIRSHVQSDDKMIGGENAPQSQNIDTSTFFVIDNMGRTKYPMFINESGMYSLIFSSKLKTAQKFKHWVTNTVLPEIRKTGSYSVALTPAEMCLKMSQAMVDHERRQKALETSVAKLQGDNKVLAQKSEVIEEKFNAVSDVIVLDDKNWRQEIVTQINRCVQANEISYQDIWALTYHELEITTHVRLNTRLANLKKRCTALGYSQAQIKKLNKLDAIESDNKLKIAYIGIIKKVVAKLTLKK